MRHVGVLWDELGGRSLALAFLQSEQWRECWARWREWQQCALERELEWPASQLLNKGGAAGSADMCCIIPA